MARESPTRIRSTPASSAMRAPGRVVGRHHHERVGAVVRPCGRARRVRSRGWPSLYLLPSSATVAAGGSAPRVPGAGAGRTSRGASAASWSRRRSERRLRATIRASSTRVVDLLGEAGDRVLPHLHVGAAVAPWRRGASSTRATPAGRARARSTIVLGGSSCSSTVESATVEGADAEAVVEPAADRRPGVVDGADLLRAHDPVGEAPGVAQHGEHRLRGVLQVHRRHGHQPAPAPATRLRTTSVALGHGREADVDGELGHAHPPRQVPCHPPGRRRSHARRGPPWRRPAPTGRRAGRRGRQSVCCESIDVRAT